MEEKKMNGQESLQMIEQMLQATKSDDVRGIRASFRVWGSACFLLGVVAFFTTTYLTNPWWNTLWFLLFLVPLIPASHGRRRGDHVTTYLEESVSKVLGTMGVLFVVVCIALFIVAFAKGTSLFQLMAPLAVIFVSYTSMQVWRLAKQKGYFAFSLVILLLGMFLLCKIVLALPFFTPFDHLATGVLLGLLFLVPGNCYNR